MGVWKVFFLRAHRAVSIYKPGEESMLPAGLLGCVQGPWLTLAGPAQHRGGTGGDSGRAQCWTCPCSVSECSWSKANSWSCNRLREQGAHRVQLGAEGTGYTLFFPLFVPMVFGRGQSEAARFFKCSQFLEMKFQASVVLVPTWSAWQDPGKYSQLCLPVHVSPCLSTRSCPHSDEDPSAAAECQSPSTPRCIFLFLGVFLFCAACS